MKNNIITSGNLVFVECSNTDPHTIFTASFESLPILERHRWRVIDGEVVTTTWKLDYEVKTNAMHVLTGKSDITKLRLKNHNPLNLTLDNITAAHKKTLNTHFVRDGVGVIVLKGGLEVTVDSSDLMFCSQYNWSAITTKKTPVVYAYKSVSNSKKFIKQQLGRYVLGVEDKTKMVIHLDGDWTNFTRNNLLVTDKRQVTE